MSQTFPLHDALHLVLRHDSVLGRNDQRIHASVTQIDIHDFCRLSLTYGLAGFHCVTEMESQHRICEEILEFWRHGYGKDYNPDRVRALQILRLHRNFEDALNTVTHAWGRPPLLVGTSAKHTEKTLDFGALPSIMERSGRPALIQFGTSWGLSPEQLRRCDWVLPPVEGHGGYNHLSVRCAAAIIIDRIVMAKRINLEE